MFPRFAKDMTSTHEGSSTVQIQHILAEMGKIWFGFGLGFLRKCQLRTDNICLSCHGSPPSKAQSGPQQHCSLPHNECTKDLINQTVILSLIADISLHKLCTLKRSKDSFFLLHHVELFSTHQPFSVEQLKGLFLCFINVTLFKGRSGANMHCVVCMYVTFLVE